MIITDRQGWGRQCSIRQAAVSRTTTHLPYTAILNRILFALLTKVCLPISDRT